MLKTMGADHIIDYSKEDLLKNGRCYDLILDVVGNRSIFDYKRLLNPAGTYVMVGGSLSLITQILFLGPLISKMEGKSMNILVHKPNKQDQNFLQQLFVADMIRPVIDRTYLLSQVAEALKYFGEGHAKRKVVICMDHKKL
jgi:NADPH:quinone reductase-like Zn-dependent oxidoreductase